MKQLTSLKAAFVLAAFVFSSNLLASHKDKHSHKSYKDVDTSIFYTYESNGDDYIAGIGAGITFVDEGSKLGFGFTTSLNNAEVRTEYGYIEDYVSWEGAIKFGYFSNVSVYGEVGVDLAELLFHDLRYDDHDHDHHHHDDDYHYDDHIDGYVGVGAGIKLGGLKVEAFSRLREVDSKYWEAESDVFTGVQFSLNF